MEELCKQVQALLLAVGKLSATVTNQQQQLDSLSQAVRGLQLQQQVQTAPPVLLVPEPKMPLPENFSGHRSDFRNFRNRCQSYFEARPIASGNEHQRVTLVKTLLQAALTGNMLAIDSITILVSVAAILFLVKVFNDQKQRKHKNLPPGPRPLPFIGNMHLIDLKESHQSLMKLSEKYGPVFTAHLALGKVVVLCGYDIIKEALIDNAEEFTDRPIGPVFTRTNRNCGLVHSNGENWKVMRRFSLTALRDYGMGKKFLEVKIGEEAEFLVQTMSSYEGKPFDNQKLVNAAVANIIVSIVLGHRFNYDDATLLNVIDLVDEYSSLLTKTGVHLYNRVPRVMSLFPGSHYQLFKNVQKMQDFITETFIKQKKDVDVNDVRNLTDAYLVKQQEKSSSSKHFHNDNLAVLMADLFVGGIETTSTTLRWALMLMVKYPEIQKKVQQEIESVIGTAQPQTEHRKQMPYTDAVIHEIHRVSDILPHGVPREASKDVPFRGYVIPKGTIILPVLYSVLTDKAYFEKPHEFYPEHFLDAKGNFKKNEAFIPFLIGKRSCVGEALVQIEMFLFFTSLLQNFTFQAPPGIEIDLTAALRVVRKPKPHKICAIPHNCFLQSSTQSNSSHS
ncbi:cytochrome P450 2B4-like [Hyperolius riggenbachi]|uniref:cytochrome P450 2B4-like n=1 Tax=Hyperolius riggenbachi TaxID=752182 RepID=UPI0035A3C69B